MFTAVGIFCIAGGWLVSPPAQAASFSTPNFVVHTTDGRLAQLFARRAEELRRELAVEWLGQALPDWASPCVITVHVGPHYGAGGATTFVFDRGEVFGWRMTIQGSAERILDSVLPHEITHMILASYFRRPIPRWADEGAATSVEHPSERQKYYHLLHRYLQTGQTLSLRQLFALEQYPANMLVLYAQGYVLADYLIQQGGRRKFVEFLKTALDTGDWENALVTHYGYADLRAFHRSWLAWVQQGSPPLRPSGKQNLGWQESPQVAARRPRPQPNLVLHLAAGQSPPAVEPLEIIPAAPLVAVDTAAMASDLPPANRGTPSAESNISPLVAVNTEEFTGEMNSGVAIEPKPSGIDQDSSVGATSAYAQATGKRLLDQQTTNPAPTRPFTPGSIRASTLPVPVGVQVGLPIATQTPSQRVLK